MGKKKRIKLSYLQKCFNSAWLLNKEAFIAGFQFESVLKIVASVIYKHEQTQKDKQKLF